MIADNDRSGYFGASDVAMVLGNTNTKTFASWWCEKLGLAKKHIKNDAMQAGTHYEHRILDFVGIDSKDKQFIVEELKLRVNLDGNTDDCIYEVKTYSYNKGFKVPKKYRQQVQVQMYASGIHKSKILAYGLLDYDYMNYFNAIDKERISEFNVEYDEEFINDVFLPRIRYLAECLEKGEFPKNRD